MKTLFNECHQDIHTDGGPDLGFDGILGGTVEGFDTQVLFNPFEEQLDLPAIAVEFGDGVCGQGKVVGEEIERLVYLRVVVFDASQGLRVVGGALGAGQDNGLVTEQAGGFIDRSRVTAAVAGIGLGPDNEEGGGDSQGKQALEIEVSAVHDVAGAGLGEEEVEDVDIVQFAVGEMDKGGDIAAQVQQGMQFDGGFGLAEARPGEHGQTQVDGGGVEGIDGIIQFQPQVVVGIQGSGQANQGLGEVGVEAPVPLRWLAWARVLRAMPPRSPM